MFIYIYCKYDFLFIYMRNHILIMMRFSPQRHFTFLGKVMFYKKKENKVFAFCCDSVKLSAEVFSQSSVRVNEGRK